MFGATIEVSHPIFVYVTGPLIPLLTGILTKFKLAGWIKGCITLTLNAVVAFLLANAVNGVASFSTETLATALIGFALSIVYYIAIWRNTPLTSSKPDNYLLPGFGFGKTAEEAKEGATSE
jgi:hypothetical protein